MEAVAEHAGVSRPLVYKHFANRDELLAAAYRREASKLHAGTRIGGGCGGHGRGDVSGALTWARCGPSVERGQIFPALRAAGGWNRDIRREQRSRDRKTVRAFAAVAARQYGLEGSTLPRCHGRFVGCARRRPGAMASRSDGGGAKDPRGDVPGDGRRRLFSGVDGPLRVRCPPELLVAPDVGTAGARDWAPTSSGMECRQGVRLTWMPEIARLITSRWISLVFLEDGAQGGGEIRNSARTSASRASSPVKRNSACQGSSDWTTSQ